MEDSKHKNIWIDTIDAEEQFLTGSQPSSITPHMEVTIDWKTPIRKKMYKLDSPKNIFNIVHGTVLKILRTQKKLQDTKGQPQKKNTFPEEHTSKYIKYKDSMSEVYKTKK